MKAGEPLFSLKPSNMHYVRDKNYIDDIFNITND
jgi:hypothetical protein